MSPTDSKNTSPGVGLPEPLEHEASREPFLFQEVFSNPLPELGDEAGSPSQKKEDNGKKVSTGVRTVKSPLGRIEITSATQEDLLGLGLVHVHGILVSFCVP